MPYKNKKRKFTMFYWDIIPIANEDNVPFPAILLFLTIADVVQAFGTFFMTIDALASRLHLSKRTVSRLIKTLKEVEWITYIDTPEKKNAITLTQKGKDIYKGKYTSKNNIEDDLLGIFFDDIE